MPTTHEVMDVFGRRLIQVPIAIAPERGPELWDEILGRRTWDFELTTGQAQFFADTHDRAIIASYAGLAALWSLAFTAYHALDLAFETQRQHGGRRNGPASADISAVWRSLRLHDYVAFATRLMANDEDWPDRLTVPNPRAPFGSVMGRINNIFLGASAWLLLHEVAHVFHRDVNDNRLRKMQERRADEFATDWILKKAGTGQRREFRVLMITIALAFLYIHERRHGTRSTYPSASERFGAASKKFGGGKRSTGLMSAAVVLKTLFDPTSSADKPFENAKEYFDWVCNRLRTPEIISPRDPIT